MRVFDFDNTLYRGESSLDFTLFMIRADKRILLYLPVIASNTIRYKLCLADKQELEDSINKYLRIIVRSKQQMMDLVTSFWASHCINLDQRMIARVRPGDIIITAGPDFLLDGIKDRLHTENIISSVVDLDRKEIVHFNFKDNKVRRFRELYGDREIDSFYTDSYNDQAMMDISKKVYLIKTGKGKRIK